ncbi:CLUMA_CG013918, isoform A [Clunio marinus]|uniref:CLUMA_CG013918, isoform A n=1 Tax=Clunio marinus TaxID=568069 RepID=A0A1J1ILM8_9DIPT|nr:CLUMA_CG013918, isoform A [Clunio marinus]
MWVSSLVRVERHFKVTYFEKKFKNDDVILIITDKLAKEIFVHYTCRNSAALQILLLATLLTKTNTSALKKNISQCNSVKEVISTIKIFRHFVKDNHRKKVRIYKRFSLVNITSFSRQRKRKMNAEEVNENSNDVNDYDQTDAEEDYVSVSSEAGSTGNKRKPLKQPEIETYFRSEKTMKNDEKSPSNDEELAEQVEKQLSVNGNEETIHREKLLREYIEELEGAFRKKDDETETLRKQMRDMARNFEALKKQQKNDEMKATTSSADAMMVPISSASDPKARTFPAGSPKDSNSFADKLINAKTSDESNQKKSVAASSSGLASNHVMINEDLLEEAVSLFSNPELVEADNSIFIAFVPKGYPRVVFDENAKKSFNELLTKIGNNCIREVKKAAAGPSDANRHIFEQLDFKSGVAIQKAADVVTAALTKVQVENTAWKRYLSFQPLCVPLKQVTLASAYTLRIPNSKATFDEAAETIQNSSEHDLDIKNWRMTVLFKNEANDFKKFLFISPRSIDHLMDYRGIFMTKFGTHKKRAIIKKAGNRSLTSYESDEAAAEGTDEVFTNRKRKISLSELYEKIAKKAKEAKERSEEEGKE